VAWQIRSGIRHFGTKLFVINSKEIKLNEGRAVCKRGGGTGSGRAEVAGTRGRCAAPALVEQLVLLKAGLEAESDVAIVFGAEISGAAITQLVAFGSKLPGNTRYMALADYANSRARRTWACCRIACQVTPM